MPLVAMNLAAADYGFPSAYPLGVNGLGATDAECEALRLSPNVGYTEYAAKCASHIPGSEPAAVFVQSREAINQALNINPADQFGQRVNVVTSAIQSLVNPYLQAQAQSSALRTQQRNEAQKIKNALQQKAGDDNTNLYLIGGGVVLAGLLLFAVARRK